MPRKATHIEELNHRIGLKITRIHNELADVTIAYTRREINANQMYELLDELARLESSVADLASRYRHITGRFAKRPGGMR